ncbi:MAG: hypothetical protein LBN04_10680, partial [Oscillospiraceae bacterium]|nr:hypothetical protein [Oscillospiraceae bacterium]
MQSITLQNGFLTVEILKKGAEIVRVQDSAGIERIWRGEPGAWDGHAPLLFPVCGALKDGQYRLDGQTYALPYHGFALVRDFAVEQADAASATFLLEGDAAYHPGFPFEYALRA